MANSIIDNPNELSPGQVKVLVELGYKLSWVHCKCGACDPEQAYVRELGPGVDSEEWEDSVNLWVDGEVREAL